MGSNLAGISARSGPLFKISDLGSDHACYDKTCSKEKKGNNIFFTLSLSYTFVKDDRSVEERWAGQQPDLGDRHGCIHPSPIISWSMNVQEPNKMVHKPLS